MVPTAAYEALQAGSVIPVADHRWRDDGVTNNRRR